MEILFWLIPMFTVFGAIAGWHAALTIRGYGFGLIGNIAVGIFGAVICVWSVWQPGELRSLVEAVFYYFDVSIISSLIGAFAGWLAGVIRTVAGRPQTAPSTCAPLPA